VAITGRAQKQGSAEAVSVGRKSNAVAPFPYIYIIT
jgi:hypothetical protein